MIPTWLRAHLETTRGEKNDGFGRTIRAGVCRRCGAHVIRGLDANVAAMPATADPTPITVEGELAAVLAGADTYDLIREGPRRYQIEHRDSFTIAGPRRHPVLATHRCGTTWPAEPDTHQPHQRTAQPEEPPY